MSSSEAPNHQQAELWNERGGIWVEQQALLDRMLAPFEVSLTEHVVAGGGVKVLDIGCGAGATTLALATRVGPGGICLGVDISAPLIAAAKARARADGAAHAAFVRADAQIHPFEREAFDAVISRFGVMFFEDPTAAFANIRQAAAPDARLAFVAWRSAAENPFMTTAARAVAPLFPPQPAPDPDAPGQFAFADAERVRRILTASGWRDIAVEPLGQDCVIAQEELMPYVMHMGPAGAAVQNADEATREEARQRLWSAFQPFLAGGRATFTAACWWVTARRGL